jgi:hypothetical protein
MKLQESNGARKVEVVRMNMADKKGVDLVENGLACLDIMRSRRRNTIIIRKTSAKQCVEQNGLRP